MEAIEQDLCRGGVVRTATLVSHGWTRSRLRCGVRTGRLRRLRRGWYAFPGADPEGVRAVASGGVLGCVSALKFYGVWDLHQSRLHVHRSEFGRRRGGGRVCWCRPVGDRCSPSSGVDDVVDALRSASCCVADEDFVVVVDSAIDRGLVSRAEVVQCLSGISDRVDRLLGLTDRAESGTESLVRLRLRARNIIVWPQVSIPGVGRVDFLIGKRLVLEVDSVEHHLSRQNYQRDRVRDQKLVALGYLVVRVTWEQVMSGWEEVEDRILTIIRHRLHLRALVGGRSQSRTSACTARGRARIDAAASTPRFGTVVRDSSDYSDFSDSNTSAAGQTVNDLRSRIVGGQPVAGTGP